MRKLFTIASLAALTLMSCGKDKSPQVDVTEGEGSVAIVCDVATDVEVTRAELTTEVSCTTPAAEDFALLIEGVSMNYKQEYAAIAEFNDSYLYNGTYRATVTAGDVTVEGYDKATFIGSEEFEVVARQHTEVKVKATIANALVKVEVTDNFETYFPGGYTLTLTTAAGNEFDVTSQSELLFIAPESFTVSGTATKQANQSGAAAQTITLPEFSKDNLAARTIYTVKMDVSNVGQATLEISLNETLVESKVIEEELNEFA